MANFSSLKQAIQNYIKENGNKEITGNLLQEILLSMVQSMGDQAINGVLQMLSNEMIARENADGFLTQALTAEQQRAIAAETKSAVLDGETKTLVFKNAAGQELYQVSVASLVTNGLVDVEVDGTNLVMTFHTESGDEEITIPIGDIFSPSNYYTKTQVDGLLLPITTAITNVSSRLNEGYIYLGVADPETIPTSATGKFFYIATQAGTYHFMTNGDIPIVISSNGLYILSGGAEADDWFLETIVTFTNNVQFNNLRLVTSGGVFNAILPIKELLRRNYMLAGVADTTTIPTEDTNVFYLAGQGGTYTHFLNGDEDPLVLPKGLTVIYRGVEDDGWNYWVVYADNDFINTNRAQALTSNQQTEAQNNLEGKLYEPAQFSGLGKKILAKNIQDVGGVDKNVMTQAFFQDEQGNDLENTVFVIQYDYTLGGNITIPAGCTLEFNGGSISGAYTITGNNTGIEAGLVKILNTDITLAGTWSITEVYPEWFGAKSDGIIDCAPAINKIVSLNAINKKIVFSQGTYKVNSTINLVGKKSIHIIGTATVKAPWRPTSLISAGAAMSHVFKLVGDYTYGTVPNDEDIARTIVFENIYINGNSLAVTGINMCDATVKGCTIRNCSGDGLVFEAMTYPVYVVNSRVDLCGGHGLYVKAPFTTVYSVKDSEFDYNEGYGIFIEDGNTSSFDSVLLQGNKRGGLRILRKRDTLFDHIVFLGNIRFVNLYTENNGLLEETDPLYDGNYTVNVESLLDSATDPSTAIGKIPNLTFENCAIYSNVYKIEGTDGTILFNTNMSLDATKNIPSYLGHIRAGSLKIGDFSNSTIDIIDIKKNVNNIVSIGGGTPYIDLKGNAQCNYAYIGPFTHYEGIIKIANASGISPADQSRVMLSFTRIPTYTSIISVTPFGIGYYDGNPVTFVRDSNIDSSKFLIKKNDNSYLKMNEITNDKTLTFSISFSK